MNRTRALLAALAVAIFAVVPAAAGADEADPPAAGPITVVTDVECAGAVEYEPVELLDDGLLSDPIDYQVSAECVDPATGDVIASVSVSVTSTATGRAGLQPAVAKLNELAAAFCDQLRGGFTDPETEPAPPDPETGTPATTTP